jgi:Tfp pilus assembly protein PilN
MQLRLNLSTAPRENKRPFIAGASLLGAIALILLAILSHQAYESWRANRDIRQNIAQLERQIQASEQKQSALETYFRTPQAQQVLDRAGFLNSLIDERSFPWTKVFADLGETLPAGVRVVSISPRLDHGRALVKLTVSAMSDDAKVKFLQTLERSKDFAEIQVQAEHREHESTNILVDLTAWYVTI